MIFWFRTPLYGRASGYFPGGSFIGGAAGFISDAVVEAATVFWHALTGMSGITGGGQIDQ